MSWLELSEMFCVYSAPKCNIRKMSEVNENSVWKMLLCLSIGLKYLPTKQVFLATDVMQLKKEVIIGKKKTYITFNTSNVPFFS